MTGQRMFVLVGLIRVFKELPLFDTLKKGQ